MLSATKSILLKVFGIDWPHWTKLVFWAVGIFIMTSLTIKDLCPLVLNYYNVDENTQVQIKLRHPDEELTAPDVHVCIPLANYSGEFHAFGQALIDNIVRGDKCVQCSLMTNQSYDVWNRIDPIGGNGTLKDALSSSLLTNRFNESLLELFVIAIEENGLENSAITIGNLSWNRPLVYSLIEYLSRQTEMERSPLNILRHQPTSEMAGFPMSLAEDRLDTLYSVLASFICSMVRLTYIGRAFATFCFSRFRSSFVVTRAVSFSGSPLFCGRLERPEQLYFSASPNYFEKFMEERQRLLIMMENPLHDVPRSHVLYGIAEGNGGPELRMEEVTITYTPQYAVLEERSSKLQSCYSESSNLECESNCYVELMESICGCRTYAYRRGASGRLMSAVGLKPCTGQEYVLCQQRLENYSASSVANCAERCSHACNARVYQWQISAGNSKNYTNEFTLNIESRHQSYLEFTMKVKDSSEDFISQIGGVFNFYLGLSGLSVILFLIHLFDVARGFVRTKRQGTETADRPNTVVRWRWRWARLTAKMAPSYSSKAISQLKHEIGSEVEKLRKNGQELQEKMENLKRQVDTMSTSVAELSSAMFGIQTLLSRKHTKPYRTLRNSVPE